jgi:yeast amino acid transporter
MADLNKGRPPKVGAVEQAQELARFDEKEDQEVEWTPQDSSTKLHRGLKARQVSMIAIGGAIGTGLIIGTGKALVTAG